jgi:DNA polymerase bacteriophage-type
LLNGEREDVALLCEARLKVKSTTERTRAQRFLDIGQRGTLPVPLSYYGAQTGRWTAAKGSAINMQNLKRGSHSYAKQLWLPKAINSSLGILSQIEPRVLAWLSDYQDMLDIFRAGGDPYAAFGAQMFNIPGLSKDSHPDLRQSAKARYLGAATGWGGRRLHRNYLSDSWVHRPLGTTKTLQRQLGGRQAYATTFIDWEDNVTKMLEIPHTCTQQELLTHCLASKKIIDIYRATAHPVATFWDMCSQLIEDSLYGGKVYQHKCLTFSKERIELPNGMSLLYPELRRTKDEKGRSQWVYGPNATKLYAGKVTNNVTQAVARIVMTDGMLRVTKKYPVVGTVHDEQIVLVPDDEVAEAKPWVLGQMTVEPKYMPGIPLAADGGAHRRYGEAKQ